MLSPLPNGYIRAVKHPPVASVLCVFVVTLLVALLPAHGRAATGTNLTISELVSRLSDEGTNHSQVSNLLCQLTDIIGPRLTGSPNCKRANEWTRGTLTGWGLTNAHLEAWGPFGRGWSLQRFAAQVIEPQAIPLIGWPKAWSCGSETSIVAEVVYLDARNDSDYERFKGKLAGKIVLVSSPREVPLHFEPLAVRSTDADLLKLANSAPAAPSRLFRAPEPPPRRDPPPSRSTSTNAAAPPATNATPRVADDGPPRNRRGGGGRFSDGMARLRFAVREGAAATVSISGSGDGGPVSVGEATVITSGDAGTNRFGGFVRAWATNAPVGPPQIVLAVEHYNRLVHLAQAGQKIVMDLDVRTRFHDDLMAYNTFAEIPGTDRKKEVVMLGAHLDSMAGGTGGADNAAGVVVCMEAVRLIKALGVEPRRTIRIGLWSGEEQGLLGSKAYVASEFGYYTNQTPASPLRSPRDAAPPTTESRTTSSRRTLIRQSGYDHFSAYYNLDNGSGRIRGIHLQGNEPLRAIFRPWLTALRDQGVDTIAASNTGGTDHLSFDAVGLPGFQFIQDPLEYTRTYHTTMDVRERVSVEDLQQASIVMALFVYQTAMLDDLLPRKPLDQETARRHP